MFPATGMLRFMFRLQESFDLWFFELLVTLTQLPFVGLSLCANIGLVVQDNTQEGIVDAKSAVVLDDAQLPEFVHEKIDPLGVLCRSNARAATGCVATVSRWS